MTPRRGWPAAAKTIAQGFCMGTADVVPGVSGGTVAYILGIYAELLDAIKSFDARWLGMLGRLDMRAAIAYPHFAFLVPLAIGIVLALLIFTRIIPIPRFLTTHPELIYGLFFGLIFGSIITLHRQVQLGTPRQYAAIIAGAVCGWLLMNAVPQTTPDTPLFVFLSGALAITAMILPGVSGSFILLILGKYAYVFDGIGRFDFAVLLPFGCGMVCGLIVFSRVLSWLLNRWRNGAMLFINGVLVASLWIIWPFQRREFVEVHGKAKMVGSSPIVPAELDFTVLCSLALALAGLAAVVSIDALAQRSSTTPTR